MSCVRSVTCFDAPGSVGVQLNPGKAWSCRCKLSIDAVQTLQAAPPSSLPVRLVFDRLVCKISKPKTLHNSGKRRLDLWAVASDECEFVITHCRGGGRGLAKFFHVGSELCSFVGRGDLLKNKNVIVTEDIEDAVKVVLDKFRLSVSRRERGSFKLKNRAKLDVPVDTGMHQVLPSEYSDFVLIKRTFIHAQLPSSMQSASSVVPATV